MSDIAFDLAKQMANRNDIFYTDKSGDRVVNVSLLASAVKATYEPVIKEAERLAKVQENERHLAGFSLASKKEKDSKLFEAIKPVFERRIAALSPKEKTEE